MRSNLGIIALIGLGLGLLFMSGRFGYAQGRNNYTCKTTSVTSSTVPVIILPNGTMTTWIIKERLEATVAVFAFPFTGVVAPGSAPANVFELSPGQPFPDQVNIATASGFSAVGQGWAAVLATGSSAMTVDACYR